MRGAMEEDPDIRDAITLAEGLVHESTRAQQDWRSVERMADELAGRARHLAGAGGQSQRTQD